MSIPHDVSTEASSPESAPMVFDRSTWLLEEYKLLSQHYFHEDSQLFKAVSIYGTLSGALLAFVGSKFSIAGPIAGRLIPAVALAICIAWFAALVRHREFRLYIEFRIAEIEEILHQHWGPAEPLPLDIRTVRSWSITAPDPHWHNWLYRVFREWSASKILLVLPLAFAVVWIVLLAFQAV